MAVAAAAVLTGLVRDSWSLVLAGAGGLLALALAWVVVLRRLARADAHLRPW
jgi:hypothetical protein